MTLPKECVPWELAPPGALDSVRYLAFAGGAVRGLEYAGVLDALRAHRGVDWGAGVPHRLHGVSGTSIGALFALLMAIGCTVDEVLRHARRLASTALVRPTLRNVVGGHMALDDGVALRWAVGSVLASKAGGARDMRFADFVARFGCDLVVVATDVRAHGLRYFRALTDPDVSVVTAVVASMALPLIFPPVYLGDAVLVDGAVGGDNFPVLLWPPHAVLGLGLTFNVAPPAADASDHSSAHHVRALLATGALASELASWRALPRAYKARTLVLRTANSVSVPSVTMQLEPQQVEALLECGRAELREALEAWGAGGGGCGAQPSLEVARARAASLSGDLAHCLPAKLLPRRQLPLFLHTLRPPPPPPAMRWATPSQSQFVWMHALVHAAVTRALLRALQRRRVADTA